MRIDRFIEKNKQFPIYKGSWNADFTKITYWFEGAGRMTLKAEDVGKVKPRWKGIPETTR